MLKVGLICPCIGVGGADALMLGLVRYCHNIQFTGCAVLRRSEIKHVAWARRMSGDMIRFHTQGVERPCPGITYHDTESEAVEAACDGADVVLSWCIHHLSDKAYNLDCPVIDYAQNIDKHAKSVIETNKLLYNAACSRSVAEVLFPKRTDIAILYNAIDPGRVTPAKGRDAQRRVWGLEDKKIILFMGRTVEEKRPNAILAALSKLDDSWVAVYVGEGANLEETYKISQQFCPGRVYVVDPQYHVGDILAAADVFVLPSDYEGHSLALCEAWLAGTPTVYTDIAVNQELTSMFGELGVMIPTCPDGQTLASAVLEATTQNDVSFARIANARHTVWNNFTLPTAAFAWEEYFEFVLNDYRQKKRLVAIHPVKPMEPKE